MEVLYGYSMIEACNFKKGRWRVRVYDSMTLQDCEYKAQELGVDSPYQCMMKGVFMDPDIRRDHFTLKFTDHIFNTKEEMEAFKKERNARYEELM
jgi:hypothetical protein